MDKKKPRNKAHKKPLGLINQPEVCGSEEGKQNYERIGCVFQGGGALGAYQAGAYKAIFERGYRPNYLSGVSIGAINCAIIAGNPPEKQLERLIEFWDTVAPELWADLFSFMDTFDVMHHLHNRIGALHSLFFGLDGFFKPRPVPPSFFTENTPDNLSFYDTSELRTTLEKLVDFDRINRTKDVTLCLGAVNVTTGEMIYFNNQITPLTVDHVLASCALPPGFPAVKIGEDYYWDGGIYANTPLVTILDALPEQDTLCFAVDCFSLKGHLPRNMDQLEERQKDIRYASHSRRLTNVYASRQNLQTGIEFLGTKLSARAKSDPEVQKILALGHKKRFSVVHIIFNGSPFSHFFKDYNFIRSAINFRFETGYQNAMEILDNPEWEAKNASTMACSIYGVPPDYFEQH